MSVVSKGRLADRILSEFGETIEIPDMIFDEQDRCFLSIRDAVVEVRLFEATDRLLLRSIIATVPAYLTPGFFGMVLGVNHAAAGSGRGFLSLDSDVGGIVWNSEMRTEAMSGASFFNAVRDAAEDIAFWTEQLDAVIVGEAPSDEQPVDEEQSSSDEHVIFRA
jgi:hypothetical protein